MKSFFYPYISSSGGGAVDSVNGQTGVVVLAPTDIGLGNVNNTSDANKPVSTATQTALNLKANLAGATFTGAISATNLSGTNTGDQDLSGKADLSGATFTGAISATNLSGTNTGDQDLSALAPLASPALTGVPTAPTAAPATNTTQIATTAFVTNAVSGSGGANTTLSNLTAPVAINQNLEFGTDNTYDIGSTSLAPKDVWFKGFLRLLSGVTTIFDIQLSGLYTVIRHLGGPGSALNIESNGGFNLTSNTSSLWNGAGGVEVRNNNSGILKIRNVPGEVTIQANGHINFQNGTEGTIGHVITSATGLGGSNWLSPNKSISVSGGYTIDPLIVNVLCNATSAFTLTFPDATLWLDRVITVKKTDSSFNRVTLSGAGMTTNYLMTVGETATFISNGATWVQTYRKTDTDWIALTPISDNFTLTSEGCFFRRRNDSIDLAYQFTDSAGVAASAAVQIPNPAAWTISSTKTAASAQSAWKVGDFHFPGAGTLIPSITDGPFVAFTDLAVSNINIYFGLASSGSRFGKQNGNALTSGGRIVMRAYGIPITDFSS